MWIFSQFTIKILEDFKVFFVVKIESDNTYYVKNGIFAIKYFNFFMPQESFTELLDQAIQMLRDRSKPEADLIYAIAIMEPELRTAIVLGYDMLYPKRKRKKKK